MTNASAAPSTPASPTASTPTLAAPAAKAAQPTKASKPAATTESKPAKKIAAKKPAAAKKTATPKTAAPAAPKPAKDVKVKKPKLVRDSFTIPKDEYAVIETLKQRAATLAQPVKKSELLRAGLKVLAGLSDSALRNALQAVPSIKTGRPKAEAAVAPTAAPAAKAGSKSRK